MNQLKVSVIVINWNGKHLLEECLASVEEQDYANFNVVFVDNGSTDGSVKLVKNKFPKIDVIELMENTGFAKANNIGMHRAFEDEAVKYVAILNNDAMVEKKWLSEAIKIALQDNQIGSVAPKIKKYYKRNVLDSTGNIFHLDGGGVSNHINTVDNGQFDDLGEIFGPSGCSSLYSRKMLEDIENNGEFFDNNFFAYFEDIDLNWRARLKGWKSYFAPNSIVYHKHSETTGLYSPTKAFYTNRNRYYIIVKDFPLFLIPKAILNLFMGYVHAILSVRKDKGPSARFVEKSGFVNAVKLIFKGWLDVLVAMPNMIKKRRCIQKNIIVSKKEIKRWLNEYTGELKNLMYTEHVK